MTEAARTPDSGLDDLSPEALLEPPTPTPTVANETATQGQGASSPTSGPSCIPPPKSPVSPPGAAKRCWPTSRSAAKVTPRYAAFAAEPLAITLGVAPVTAKQADHRRPGGARHRLPGTWKRVAALEVPAWKGRHVAVLTHTLSLEAAEWVDQQIAPRLHRCGARAVDTVVAHAIAKYDPDRHAAREARAEEQTWDVTLHTPTASEYAATSELHITGDTLILSDLYRNLSRDAVAAGKAGDDQPLGVRKVQALATLFTGAQAATLAGGRAASEASDPSRPPPQTVLYLHLDKTDLDDDNLAKIGRAERLGPATTDKIRDWVAAPPAASNPSSGWTATTPSTATTHPTASATRSSSATRPARFPGCQVDSRRCDLDHVIPYDPGGPPSQTRPSNLVPLCRRHHNAKTTGLWRYTRTPEGDCVWTGPFGTTATS